MDEGGGEKPRRFSARVKQVLEEKVLGRVPIEKMDDGSVVRAVDSWRGNPWRANLADNPFTTYDILDLLGYTTAFIDDDPYKVFPEAYRKVRESLQKLVHQNILEMETDEEPDVKGERLFYTVVDKEKLSELARDSKMAKASKKS